MELHKGLLLNFSLGAKHSCSLCMHGGNVFKNYIAKVRL